MAEANPQHGSTAMLTRLLWHLTARALQIHTITPEKIADLLACIDAEYDALIAAKDTP